MDFHGRFTFNFSVANFVVYLALLAYLVFGSKHRVPQLIVANSLFLANILIYGVYAYNYQYKKKWRRWVKHHEVFDDTVCAI